MAPDTPDFRTYIGSRIRRIREARGMSQYEVARKMQLYGYTSFIQSRQSEVEAGRKPVSLREAVCYARIFRVTVDEIVGDPKI